MLYWKKIKRESKVENMNRRNTKKQKQQRIKKVIYVCGIVLVLLFAVCIGYKVYESIFGDRYTENKSAEVEEGKPNIDVQLLDVNPYSRPGTKSDKITGIVIHYTANPGAGAMQNRNYFDGLKDSHETKASSHFVVGLEGEIVQCIPTWEVAYASNDRNSDTVSIECCHPNEDGEFNDGTYQSMVQLTAWLCKKFDLDESDVIRHYDVTGKNCPKYFVENEKAWQQFRKDIKKAL